MLGSNPSILQNYSLINGCYKCTSNLTYEENECVHVSSGFMLRLVSCGDFEVWCSDFVVDICVYKTVGFILSG